MKAFVVLSILLATATVAEATCLEGTRGREEDRSHAAPKAAPAFAIPTPANASRGRTFSRLAAAADAFVKRLRPPPMRCFVRQERLKTSRILTRWL
jgi:hypothetical protein